MTKTPAPAIPTAPTVPNENTVSWLAYCRAGFEPDLAAEFTAKFGATPRTLVALPLSGFVIATFLQKDAKRAAAHADWRDWIFARQMLRANAEPITLTTNDRVTPIVAAAKVWLAQQKITKIGAVWIEYPDTNDGKALSKLAQALQLRIGLELTASGLIKKDDDAAPRLHVLLTPQREAFLALGDVQKSSSWPLGIARLKMPREAPSRSTLKLAEALHIFVGDNEERIMRPDMRAVDLGAAPGGWTWQLIHRGLHVTAIDNGTLKGELVDNALVKHLREDGFRYRPKRGVDWMVCDMVEQPARIAALVAMWFREGWTERCIFNLKLPMKKRLDEVTKCRAVIEQALQMSGREYEIRIKQLYHDREEVTGFCRYVPRPKRG